MYIVTDPNVNILATFGKVNQQYLGSFEMWCWRRTEKISQAGRVRNEKELHRVKEERNTLRKAKNKES
jgi:hypothetical protein